MGGGRKALYSAGAVCGMGSARSGRKCGAGSQHPFWGGKAHWRGRIWGGIGGPPRFGLGRFFVWLRGLGQFAVVFGRLLRRIGEEFGEFFIGVFLNVFLEFFFEELF